MTDEQHLKILQRAVEKYGLQAQAEMLMEELAELIVATSKLFLRSYPPEEFYTRLDNFIEEVADTTILVGQARQLLLKRLEGEDVDLDQLIDDAIDRKMLRLKKRLGMENE